MEKYYIYAHIGENGEVIYIGKGSKKRAYNLSCRTYTKEEVKEIIILPMRYTNEDEAYKVEEIITKFYKERGECKYNIKSGNKIGEETKKKISENHADITGEKNPFYGKKHTEETKNKQRGGKNHQAKKVRCIETGEIFDCIKYACEWCGKTGVDKCCKGINKTCGGYHWEYVEKVKGE